MGLYEHRVVANFKVCCCILFYPFGGLVCTPYLLGIGIWARDAFRLPRKSHQTAIDKYIYLPNDSIIFERFFQNHNILHCVQQHIFEFPWSLVRKWAWHIALFLLAFGVRKLHQCPNLLLFFNNTTDSGVTSMWVCTNIGWLQISKCVVVYYFILLGD